MNDNKRTARAWLTQAMSACRCKPNVAEATLCWPCAIGAFCAAVRAKGEAMAYSAWQDATAGLTYAEICKGLNAHVTDVPEPPR